MYLLLHTNSIYTYNTPALLMVDVARLRKLNVPFTVFKRDDTVSISDKFNKMTKEEVNALRRQIS